MFDPTRLLAIHSVVSAFVLIGCDDRPPASTVDASIASMTDAGTPTSSVAECEALCRVDESRLDVCSATSVGRCVSLCESRVQGADGLCRSCLLEGASFRVEGSMSGSFCNANDRCPLGALCELRGCMYCSNDEAMESACRDMVREEVDCDPEFEPVSDCADLCD